MIHILLHFFIPAAAAWFAYRDSFWQSWLVMIATMLIDLDHLLATPIYDPNRCSIGFHPLHSSLAIFGYFMILMIPKLRQISIGLLIHLGLDLTDCIF